MYPHCIGHLLNTMLNCLPLPFPAIKYIFPVCVDNVLNGQQKHLSYICLVMVQWLANTVLKIKLT